MTVTKQVVEVTTPISDGYVPIYSASGNSFSQVAVTQGGWQTVLDLDFTAQTTQNLTANGTYTIGGIAGWQRENAPWDKVAMVLTNGSGLRIRPGQGTGNTSSVYDSTGRTAPLLWLPLSALGIAKLSWQTSFRLWLQIGAETLGAGPGLTNNDYVVIGIDDNGTTNDAGVFYTPGYGTFGSSPTQSRFFHAGSRRQNEFSTAVGAATFATNPVATFMTQVESLAIYPPRTQVFYNPTSPAWPNEFDLRPLVGSNNTSITDFRTLAPNNASTGLGLVIGAAAQSNNDSYDVTITRVRVDYKL
jgi:hypothetical protein